MIKTDLWIWEWAFIQEVELDTSDTIGLDKYGLGYIFCKNISVVNDIIDTPASSHVL